MSAGGVSLQACLNGWSEHPAAPRTPAQLESDAAACVAAGADGLHLHVLGVDGRQTLAPTDVDAAVSAVRTLGIEISLSTAEVIEPELRTRLSLIRDWSVLPDVCSVNFSEDGAEQVARALAGRGVQFEAGLASVEDAERFAESGTAALCRRVLVEVPDGDGEAAVAHAGRIEAALDRRGLDVPRLLHGEGAATWDVLRAALGAGRAIRIGLEDVETLPDGSPAPDNAALVMAAKALAG